MREQELQDAVAELAQTFGYMVAHSRPARTKDGWRTAWSYDGKGYFDLTMIGRGRVLFVEVKGTRGVVSPEQQRWHIQAREAGLNVFVWWPKDWLDGTIEKVLR